MNDTRFKKCNACRQWFSLDDILHNPEIEPLGMLASSCDPYEAYFLFLHNIPTCQSSFMIRVEDFKGLLRQKTPSISFFRTTSCEGHCANLLDLTDCRQDCRNAPYRRLLFEMQSKKKAQIA